MTILQVRELTDDALDWAVHECLDRNQLFDVTNALRNGHRWQPSTTWLQGGPLIKHLNIGILPPTSRVHRHGGPNAGWGPSGLWSATTFHAGFEGKRAIAYHKTDPLIAAMRCYVIHHFGMQMDVPAELLP